MEKWIDCCFYPDRYEVSSLGRVRSKDRMSNNSRGKSQRFWKGRVISLTMDSKKNYLLAKLCAYRERKTFLVHRLIAYSFYGGDFSLTVNHKNGVKTDNRVENLEIVTISENRTHAVKTGLWTPARGSQNGKASIDEDVVKMIRELRSDGLTYDQIAEKVQSSHKVVGDICRGRTWSHV